MAVLDPRSGLRVVYCIPILPSWGSTHVLRICAGARTLCPAPICLPMLCFFHSMNPDSEAAVETDSGSWE
jgi:hypothetical protein